FAIEPSGRALVAVREDHSSTGQEAVTTIVRIPLAPDAGLERVIASGFDFYAAPRFSPDGSRLSWLAWRHPQMPWDGTEVWTADVTIGGELTNATRVAGGEDESVFQPGWSPDGTLYFVSDRSGWWNLYRVRGTTIESVLPMEVEFGRPLWQLGTTT